MLRPPVYVAYCVLRKIAVAHVEISISARDATASTNEVATGNGMVIVVEPAQPNSRVAAGKDAVLIQHFRRLRVIAFPKVLVVSACLFDKLFARGRNITDKQVHKNL